MDLHEDFPLSGCGHGSLGLLQAVKAFQVALPLLDRWCHFWCKARSLISLEKPQNLKIFRGSVDGEKEYAGKVRHCGVAPQLESWSLGDVRQFFPFSAVNFVPLPLTR